MKKIFRLLLDRYHIIFWLFLLAVISVGAAVLSGPQNPTANSIPIFFNNKTLSSSGLVLDAANISDGQILINNNGNIQGTNNLTIDTLIITGNIEVTGSLFPTNGIQLLEGSGVKLDATGSADGAWSGITRAGTAGATLAFGDLIVLDPTDSRWELADANSASGADGDARGMIGICVLAAASDGNATTVLLQGIVRADAVFPSFTINAPLYVSETAGDITGTIPTTSGNVVRRLGTATTADEIYFAPGDFSTYVP